MQGIWVQFPVNALILQVLKTHMHSLPPCIQHELYISLHMCTYITVATIDIIMKNNYVATVWRETLANDHKFAKFGWDQILCFK